MTTTLRPAPTEFDRFYDTYVSKVPDGDIAELLAEQRERVLAAFRGARPGFAYEPGKWTSEEVVVHVVDIERVFSYRAMCWSRGLVDAPLIGVDQEIMVRASGASRRGLASLAGEFDHMRRANVELVQGLDDAQLSARGTASGFEMTTRAMLYVLYGHAEHHARVLGERYA